MTKMNNIIIFSIAVTAVAVTCVSSQHSKEDPLIIQGVDVTKLSHSELQSFCKILDEEFAGQLDLHLFKSTLAEIRGRRQKRFIFPAYVVYFQNFTLAKSYVASKVAADATARKVYSTYDVVDTYKNVYDTFNGLRPDDVKSTVIESGHNGGEKIMTGEIGDIKVTARSHGPSGLPTLELNGEKMVREIRFSR